MQERYNFSEIEKKWQKQWTDTNAFKVVEDINKKKYYVLEMFPTLRESFIWGMSETIQLVMWLPDSRR